MRSTASESKSTSPELKPVKCYLDTYGYLDLDKIPFIWTAPKAKPELSKEEETYVEKRITSMPLEQRNEYGYEILLEVDKFLGKKARLECLKLFTQDQNNSELLKLLQESNDVAFSFGEFSNYLNLKPNGPGLFFYLNGFLLHLEQLQEGGLFPYELYFFDKKKQCFILFASEDRVEIPTPSTAPKKNTAEISSSLSLPIGYSVYSHSKRSWINASLITERITPDSKQGHYEYPINTLEVSEFYKKCKTLRDTLMECILNPEINTEPTIVAFQEHTNYVKKNILGLGKEFGSFYTDEFTNYSKNIFMCEMWFSPHLARCLAEKIDTLMPEEAKLLTGKNPKDAVSILKKKGIVSHIKSIGPFIQYDEKDKKITEGNGSIIHLSHKDSRSLAEFLNLKLDTHAIGSLSEGIKSFTALVNQYNRYSALDRFLGKDKSCLAEIDQRKKTYPKGPDPVPLEKEQGPSYSAAEGDFASTAHRSSSSSYSLVSAMSVVSGGLISPMEKKNSPVGKGIEMGDLKRSDQKSLSSRPQPLASSRFLSEGLRPTLTGASTEVSIRRRNVRKPPG